MWKLGETLVAAEIIDVSGATLTQGESGSANSAEN